MKLESPARHCRIAELAAILVYAGAVKEDENGVLSIELSSDAPYVEKRARKLYDGLFECTSGVEKLLHTIKYTKNDTIVSPVVMKSSCCKRAFLRGAFLAVGSMSNPEKGYHLEFVCGDTAQAEQLLDALRIFDIQGKTVARKKYQIVYIKESEEIVELLNVIGAHISLMNLENLRILKDMRNSVNRRVNCETANISKTVTAASKQIEDIRFIREHYGFDNLPDNLRQIAELRLARPDATLKELGEALAPPVGKSGVNHRLRKLCDLAEHIRTKKEMLK